MDHVRILISLVLAMSLVGCGGEESATGHEADVAFATDMIPHHAQALVMVDMVQGRKVSSAFKALTEQSRATQAPEIEEMATWLDEWGEEIPETSRDHVNGGHGGHGDHGDLGGGHMSHGMVSAEDMEKLHAEKADFESMWLRMMIEHHEGAIDMAKDEIENGKDPRAIELAESMGSSQTAQIETMENMLG